MVVVALASRVVERPLTPPRRPVAGLGDAVCRRWSDGVPPAVGLPVACTRTGCGGYLTGWRWRR